MTENEAIKRIKEFGLHHAIGDLPYSAFTVKAFEMAIKALEEIQQYQKIGTVKECREAVEKQKAKTPYVWGDGYSDGKPVYDMYDCPNCGTSYEIECDHYKYCPECGQRLDLQGCFNEQPACGQEG